MAGLAVFALVGFLLLLGDLLLLRDLRRRRTGTGAVFSRAVRGLLVASALGQVALLVDGFLVEPVSPVVERNVFVLKGLAPADDGGLRLLHLSDLHLEEDGLVVPDLLPLVAAQKPDLIALTGDYLNAWRGSVPLGQIARGLRKLAPVFAVRGNFDGHPLSAQILGEAGVELLDGRARRVEIRGRVFELHGVSLWTRHRLEALARERRPELPAILLCHVPDLIDRAAALGYDLVLCGHTHGGQIRVPGYGAIVTLTGLGKRYEAGRYRVGSTEAWVSRGPRSGALASGASRPSLLPARGGGARAGGGGQGVYWPEPKGESPMNDMEQKAKALLDAGIRQVKAGRTEEALQSFLHLTASYPSSDVADNAWYNMGQLYLKQERFGKAHAAFKMVLDEYPNSDAALFAGDQLDEIKHQADPSVALFEDAQHAYIQQDFQKARDLYLRLVTETPDSALADNAHLALGVLGRRLGDEDLARKHFDIVRERYAGSDAARVLAEMESGS